MIAVIGAGISGREIAHAALRAGFSMILEDMSGPRLEAGTAWIRQSLDEALGRGEVRAGQIDAAMTRFSAARSVEDASRQADLVIEAAPEEMELKLEIFTLLDKFAKPGSIFASTASSLPISEIAAITFRADKCIGMHFVGSALEGNVLELICGPATSEDTIAACREVGSRMGKEIVVVAESAYFARGAMSGQ